MAAVRSPNYPQIDLGEALNLARTVYAAENRNRMSRDVLSKHFGYSSLNGRALAKIGAVRAYGLIEGTQDELRLTEDAITCLEAPEGSQERASALMRCSTKPSIFQEISAEYPTLPSEHNLKFFLVKRHYTSEAAGKAAQTYLATMRLVSDSGGSYYSPEPTEAAAVETMERLQARAAPSGAAYAPGRAALGAGMRQSVFNLDEGDVTLTFPANLSSEGYAELKEYLDIFLRRAQRAKRLEEAQDDFSDLK
jgi:hypothetical protein